MTETIKTNQLTPNRKFFVRGKVVYSRIASKIDGKELIELILKQLKEAKDLTLNLTLEFKSVM